MPSLLNTLLKWYWIRLGADEQARSDLRVRQPFNGQPRHLHFLRRQPWAAVRCRAALRGLPRGHERTSCPLGEPRHPHRLEHVVGGVKLLARVVETSLPAQPFPEEQMGAAELHANSSAAQPLDRFYIQTLSIGCVTDQRSSSELRCRVPNRCHWRWCISLSRATASAATWMAPLRAAASMSSIVDHADRAISGCRRALCRGQRRLMIADPVVDDGFRPLGHTEPHTFAAAHDVLDGGLDRRRRLELVAAEGGEAHGGVGCQAVAGRSVTVCKS